MLDSIVLATGKACAAVTCAAATPPIAVASPWWWTAAAAPVATAVLAVVGAWIAIRFDRRKSLNQELIKKRIAIYDCVAPLANDLLCCVTCSGGWKKLPPDKMIEKKREIDHSMYVYGALFSERLTIRFHEFMDACFATFQGRGKAAVLRANRDALKRQWGDDWKNEWDAAFVDPTKAVPTAEIRQRYKALLDQLAIEIGAANAPRFAWARGARRPPVRDDSQK